MKAILLDTHTWAWSLTGSVRLSQRAMSAITGASAIHVSPVSFFEIGQKVRLGKWPEMAPYVGELPNLLARQGGRAAPCTPEICLAAAAMVWDHRDPFDRIIAATAAACGLPLISADTVFDGHVTRVW